MSLACLCLAVAVYTEVLWYENDGPQLNTVWVYAEVLSPCMFYKLKLIAANILPPSFQKFTSAYVHGAACHGLIVEHLHHPEQALCPPSKPHSAPPDLVGLLQVPICLFLLFL